MWRKVILMSALNVGNAKRARSPFLLVRNPLHHRYVFMCSILLSVNDLFVIVFSLRLL